VFNSICRLPSANRLHVSSGANRGQAAARIGLGVARFRLSPPRVDYLGCPAVGWETEL
jgi:hypothetical protein